MNANLANDTTVRVDVHIAQIVWEGVEQDVLALATGRRPLLGTALLDHKRFCADFEEGGTVVIDDVP